MCALMSTDLHDLQFYFKDLSFEFCKDICKIVLTFHNDKLIKA